MESLHGSRGRRALGILLLAGAIALLLGPASTAGRVIGVLLLIGAVGVGAVPAGRRRPLGILLLIEAAGLGFVPMSSGGETTCPGFFARWFTDTNPGCGPAYSWLTLPVAAAFVAAGAWLIRTRRPDAAHRPGAAHVTPGVDGRTCVRR